MTETRESFGLNTIQRFLTFSGHSRVVQQAWHVCPLTPLVCAVSGAVGLIYSPSISNMLICTVASLLYPVGSLVGVSVFASVLDTSRYMLDPHVLSHIRRANLTTATLHQWITTTANGGDANRLNYRHLDHHGHPERR